jgi:ABC-type spermidine/putrescine transport system permease subunit II
VACTALICLPAAALFARETFKGKQFLEVALLLPALVPSITFSMGIHYLFVRTGIANSYIGVILVITMFSYPYMLRALTAGYRAFGKEYAQCAANLGAGRLLRLFKVELPLIAPSLIAGGTIVFLVAFTEYFLVFLIGGGAVPSYAGYLFPMLLSSDRPVAALLTLIFLVVPLLLFWGLEAAVVRMYRKKGLM